MAKYKARIKGKPSVEKFADCLCGGRTVEQSKAFVKKGGKVYATSCFKGKESYSEKILRVIKYYKL